MAGKSVFGSPLGPSPKSEGPVGFQWLLPGLLGGTPLPKDFSALQRVGTRLLVSLTAEWQPDEGVISRHGMRSLYAPIPDFQPPTLAQAAQVCAAVAGYTGRGEAVVFHCQAGKGRTGTMLAAMLIWAGHSAEDAIAQTRGQNAAWIETDGQLAFLSDFASQVTGFR